MGNYNYIILGSPWDFYKCAYSDVINLENVRYIDRPINKINNIFVRLLHRLHNLPQINSIVGLPFRDFWLKKYLTPSFRDKRPVVFLIFADWCCRNNILVDFISKEFPEAKKVLIYNDLIHTKIDFHTNKPLDILSLKKKFDLILSFDFGDAQKYQIEYYPIPYSVANIPQDHNQQIESDVYFLGQAKNRLHEIMDTYKYLKSLGLKTNFIISGVKRDDQIIDSGIRYVRNNEISYLENLQNIANTKCILEIMQKGGSGYTSRTLEAITYDKKLITNNTHIKKAPFYNPEYMCVFEKINEINPEFIKNLKTNESVDYHYKEKLSPLKLLEFLEEKLSSFPR